MYSRNVAAAIQTALSDRPVVLLQGARQTGKSTLVKAAAPDATYLTLDDAATLAVATSDPTGFVEQPGKTLIIDEVQRVPQLFRAIKASVDRDRRPGRFLLTGSANVLLLPQASESLAGRMEIITLQPLSQGEIEGTRETFIDLAFGHDPIPQLMAPDGPVLAERVVRGGFPEVVASVPESRRNAWFSSYLTSVLQQDIRDITNIEDATALPRLAALLASRTAGLLNQSDISRSLGVPQTTLRRYFSLLEASFLVSLIPAWSINTGLRLSKSPKLFFNDTGLACELTGIDAASFDSVQTPKGTLIETFFAAELSKQSSWSSTKPRFYHFRAHRGEEVDIVMEDRKRAVVGVEIKASRTLNNDDFRGLRTLQELAGKHFRRGIILYGGPTVLPFGKDLVAVPHHTVWSV